MLLGSKQPLTAVWRHMGFCVLIASTACSTPGTGPTADEAEAPSSVYARFIDIDYDDTDDQVWLDGVGVLSENSDRSTVVAINTAVTTAADVSPQIIIPARPLQCVPYARAISDVSLYGNAATWWQAARGRYARGNVPRVGAVLVMRATRRIPLGHVAVVSKVLNSREIVVHHANWLNERAIHRDTPVRDVSKNNDWSAVRVWYTPGNQYGAGVYPSHGFIYPEQPKRFVTIANVNVRNAPSTYAHRAMTLPRNSEIEVVEEVRDALWYRVARHGRVLGYVYAELVEPLDDRQEQGGSPSREARARSLPPS